MSSDTRGRARQPWDSLAYHQIVSACYRNGELNVGFADGTEARLSPSGLVSPEAPPPDWERVRAEKVHIVAPSPAGDVEIPWDVIRARTDPAYDAFWVELVADRAAATAGG